jgi:hypothetical protein
MDIPLPLCSWTVPVPQLSASKRNSSQWLNCSSSLTHSLTHQPTHSTPITPRLASNSHQPPTLFTAVSRLKESPLSQSYFTPGGFYHQFILPSSLLRLMTREFFQLNPCSTLSNGSWPSLYRLRMDYTPPPTALPLLRACLLRPLPSNSCCLQGH